jgi:ribosome maturation factor RimP
VLGESGESPIFCIYRSVRKQTSPEEKNVSVVDTIRPMVESTVSGLGFELYGIKFFRAGKHSVLRIFIDKTGGVSIQDCEQVSRDLSELLDEQSFTEQTYALEVSSPGTDWPLAEERDFRRIIGHEVVLRLHEPLDNSLKLQGTVSSCDATQVTLTCEKAGSVSVAYTQIQTGKVELKF